MVGSLGVAMLLTDGFGGFGGIAKFNRDFLQAVDACAFVERVHALPRIIRDPIEEVIPESVVYDRRAARGKIAFMKRVLALALRGGRIELVVCGHLHLLPAAWLLARLRGARLALIVHGIEAWVPTRHALANWLTRSVDTFIAVSHYSAERFARWSKAPLDQVSILPNCVDLSRFYPQPRDTILVERYGLQSSRVLLTVGRLSPSERYKGFDEVIEAVPQLIKEFPTLKYLIVGDGADRGRLEAKAKALGIYDRVIFAGRISESEKVAHYNLADAFVMPSFGEGFGIVLIEAAACGVPVIGSQADGSREALLDGRLGRLIDPKQMNELLEAVAVVLKAGSRQERNEAIATFDVDHFRARVTEWLGRQTTCISR